MVTSEFDFNADLCGNDFKSCFARSVAVNSQHRQKTADGRQLQSKDSFSKNNKGSLKDNVSSCEPKLNELPNIARLVKVSSNTRFKENLFVLTYILLCIFPCIASRRCTDLIST